MKPCYAKRSIQIKTTTATYCSYQIQHNTSLQQSKKSTNTHLKNVRNSRILKLTKSLTKRNGFSVFIFFFFAGERNERQRSGH